MKEKFIADEYYEWRYCEINTASELTSYINKIKGCIIGKAINNIFIQPEFPPNRTHIAGYNILNNNSVECLDLVGPSIIKIDEHLIVFDMFGISNLKISFDGLFKVVNTDIMYCEVTSLFSKYIIGQKIESIEIVPITQEDAKSSEDYCSEDVLSDDMFQKLVFALENGRKFTIRAIWDNTGIVVE